MWPRTASELVRVQRELAAAAPPPWRPSGPRPLVAGCFVCFGRGATGAGDAGEPGWAAAALMRGDRRLEGTAVVAGFAGAPYEAGLLALRDGALLEGAVRALPELPEVVIAQRLRPRSPPPRRAGPPPRRGARPAERRDHGPAAACRRRATGAERRVTSPLLLDGAKVARALRTRSGARPIVVHPGWRDRPRRGHHGRGSRHPSGPHSRAPAPCPARGASGARSGCFGTIP